eukprot:358176-Chlamydomonas_euryale.AAC.2
MCGGAYARSWHDTLEHDHGDHGLSRNILFAGLEGRGVDFQGARQRNGSIPFCIPAVFRRAEAPLLSVWTPGPYRQTRRPHRCYCTGNVRDDFRSQKNCRSQKENARDRMAGMTAGEMTSNQLDRH